MFVVRSVLGVLAAMLPARWWPWLDQYVPATAAAPFAAIVTVVVSMALGIPGFLRYVEYLASSNNAAALEIVKRNPQLWDHNAAAILRGAPTAFTAVALPLFLFTTPLGLASLYLAISGLLRGAASIVEGGFGDPIVTGVDKLIAGARRRRLERRERDRREALEGPDMPDRIMSAAQLGIAGADFVIVSSRRKAEWDSGTVVQTPDGAVYRVGTIEDRTIAGRLRTLYPLTEHKDLEVFRRVVQYELPPGRKS